MAVRNYKCKRGVPALIRRKIHSSRGTWCRCRSMQLAAADLDPTNGCSMDSQMDKQAITSPHMSFLQELERLMDPTVTHNSKTAFLLLGMMTEEARIYARMSLGLEAGDVRVFLEFLEDKHDKRSGMIDTTPNQDNKDSLMMPWQHLPPLPSNPGQPWSSLALAAVTLAQKQQGWPDQTIKDAREVETTQAQPRPNHQVAQMDLTEEWTAQDHVPQPCSDLTQESSREVKGTAALSLSPNNGSHMDLAGMGGGSLGLKMGAATSGHSHGQRELKSGVDNPSQGGQSVSLGHQVGHGVETVMSDEEQETPAPPKAVQGTPMVSPLLASPPVTASQPPSQDAGRGSMAPTEHRTIGITEMLLPPPKGVTHTAPGASILRSPAYPQQIPLKTRALVAMQTPLATVDIPHNLKPRSSGNRITFASIAIFHRDSLVDPGVNVYECLKVFELLLRADPRATVLPLYANEAGVRIAPIITDAAYPTDVLGLSNYAQISNPYTLSKVVEKDAEGNQKPQWPTYVYMRIATDLLFLHVVDLIQPNLNQINVNVKEKKMPYLDTKTRYAIVGTTNGWCSVALQEILIKELTKCIGRLQDGGYLDGEHPEEELSPCMIHRAKLKLTQIDTLISKEDVEFINCFACLSQ
jgi:hypothetical protein